MFKFLDFSAMTNRPITIIDALHDRQLFGALPTFKNLQSWSAWVSWLKSVFALPMTAPEFDVYKKCTGRTKQLQHEPGEVFTIVGRRGGKSFISALCAVFIAAFSDFTPYLTTGETATVVVLARDREQARVVFRYVKGIFNAVPVLRQMVVSERADEVELSNGVSVLVKTSDFRGLRGLTVAAAICDELAFWDSEGISPDSAVLNAIRPSMATIPGAKLLCISTGYAQVGTLYEMHKENFGRDESDVLVWQAETRTMNPGISQAMIEREIAKDPEAARAEWLGLFREDVTAAFPLELLEKNVIPGRSVLPFSPDVVHMAFTDPCGGRRDRWAQSIGHVDGNKIIVDRVDFWKSPLDTAVVTAECSAILKSYRVQQTIGDSYAGAWPEQEFKKAENGIQYVQADKNKSELYLNLIPLLSSGEVELPDNKMMLDEFRRLERRRGRSGKDTIDHLPSLHDDIANSVAGLAYVLSGERGSEAVIWTGGERTFGGDAALYDDSPFISGGGRRSWDW
jgi:hypothetical protein